MKWVIAVAWKSVLKLLGVSIYSNAFLARSVASGRDAEIWSSTQDENDQMWQKLYSPFLWDRSQSLMFRYKRWKMSAIWVSWATNFILRPIHQPTSSNNDNWWALAHPNSTVIKFMTTEHKLHKKLVYICFRLSPPYLTWFLSLWRSGLFHNHSSKLSQICPMALQTWLCKLLDTYLISTLTPKFTEYHRNRP